MSGKRTQIDRDFDLDIGRQIERKDAEIAAWIAYADKLESVLEIVCGASKDELLKMHAAQGLRLVRPNGERASG